jgi:hypothetical protein
MSDDDVDWAQDARRWEGVVQAQPRDAAAWFNLGLAKKWRRDWAGCVEANLRALEISCESGDPAWWNLGIAATALRDWKTARRAWRGFGLEIPDGDGALELDYGIAPVRLMAGEVVWGHRIDPARLIVRSIPLRDSGHRWGDVVLHDGAPNGERTAFGQTYSVFDELERWSPSEIPTLRVQVYCADNGDSTALVDAFEAAKFAAEDWTASVRALCRACSEGNPDAGHAHGDDPVSTEREFGLASPMGLATRLLRQWREASPATRDFTQPETTEA